MNKIDITKKLLEEINPNISAYEWMQGDPVNKDTYNDALDSNINSSIGLTIGDSINLFDSAVNPFLLDDVSLDDLPKMLSKMDINVEIYSEKRKGCCSIEFKDLNTGCKTSYNRFSNGFSFQLNYKFSNGDFFTFMHYFSTNNANDYDNGEFLAINGKSNHKQWVDLRFNLTKWKAGKTYEKKRRVNPLQIVIINDALQHAIKLAADITLQDIKGKDVTLTR